MILCVLLFTGVVTGAVVTNARSDASVTFQANIGGTARYGFLAENMMYGLVGTRLYIADAADPTNPVELGSTALPGNARRMEVHDGIAYISCSQGGLAIVDVTNPAQPRYLATVVFDTREEICQTFDVVVRGTYAYVADHTGFHAVDVTVPASPVVVNSFTAFDNEKHEAYDVHVDGNYAFLSCQGDGMYIFDIAADPASPQKVSSFKSAELSQFYSSFSEGDYLYVAGGISGLVILDISDIASPQLVSYMPDNDYGGALVVTKKDSLVYVTTETTGIRTVDVSDVTAPVDVGALDFGEPKAYGMWHQENTLVYANGTYGIRILDVSGSEIVEKGVLKSVGAVMDCVGHGDHAFAAAGENGLYVLDVSDPETLGTVAHRELDGYANGLYLSGSTLYVVGIGDVYTGTGGFLQVVDVTLPESPLVLGSVGLEGEPMEVVVRGNTAYVATQTKGVALVDVSDPSDLSLLSAYDTSGVCYDVLLWGGMLLCADGLNGFSILDISDSLYPKKVIGGYDLGNVQDISLWDNYLFLAGGSEGLSIADVAAPYSPSFAQKIEPGTKRLQDGQITASDTFLSYLLLADTAGGLRLFDLAQPAAPVELAADEYIQGDPLRVAYNFDQQTAYVCSQVLGLYVYTVAVDDEPSVDVDGIWVGTGTAGQDVMGITAELDQAHAGVSGTVALYGTQSREITVNGTIEAASGEVAVSDGGDLTCLLVSSGAGMLTGQCTGGQALSDIQLQYAGPREGLTLADTSPVLKGAVESCMDGSGMLETLLLSIAGDALDGCSACDDAACELMYAAAAHYALSFMESTGPVAAAQSYLYPSAYRDIMIAQVLSLNMADGICPDYQPLLSFFHVQGDSALEKGVQAAGRGDYAGALGSFSIAAYYYQNVFQQYEQFSAYCPDFGVAEMDGYHKGVIDFGFAQATLSLCASQAEDGTVTGEAFIAVETSGSTMDGVLVDCVNTGDTESVFSGTIEVKIGEKTAHIMIQDWKYSASANQWEGRIEVVEQEVSGNVALKKVSDECPEGWNTL